MKLSLDIASVDGKVYRVQCKRSDAKVEAIRYEIESQLANKSVSSLTFPVEHGFIILPAEIARKTVYWIEDDIDTQKD